MYTLLNKVSSANCNALIDTGALITGLSNYEVALYLLRNGLRIKRALFFWTSLIEK